MANIQAFEYQNNKVRTVDVDGEAWFVLKDVCAVLGIVLAITAWLLTD